MNSADRFAAKVRRARLAVKPPIDLCFVEQFESDAGISIPGDYRDFLLHVANGGNEPCRLVPLSGWCNSYWINDPKQPLAAEPCMVTPEACDRGEHWLSNANVPDWEKRWDRNDWDPMFGTIAIAEVGCGLFFSMIMTGQHRGRIFSWGDHALNAPHFCPEACFGDWFESCLDATLDNRPVHFLDGRLR